MPRQNRRSVVKSIFFFSFFVAACYALLQFYGVFTLYKAAARPFAPVTPVPSRQDERCDGTLAPVSNIAIIGAGSAGASTAYHVRRWASPCTPVNITVFERAHYVGGRSTTVHVHDDPQEPVELGGSIFVAVNHVLVDTAAALGLATRNSSKSPPPNVAGAEVGIWDGAHFRFELARDEPRWKLAARLLWRYGTAPVRVQALMRDVIHRFLQLYEAPQFPFRSLSSAVEAVELTEATGSTGGSFLDARSVGPDYAADIVQASTRVNYAQNLAQIHGLETMVCMAAEGEPMAIDGGNWRLFAGMLAASEASLRLETAVTEVRRKDGRGSGGGFALRTNVSQTDQHFDAVVLAAPWAASKIHLDPPVINAPAAVEYVPLHVTLFASPYRLRPSYFGLAPDQPAPATILTTPPRYVPKTSKGADGAKTKANDQTEGEKHDDEDPDDPVPFFSISLLRSVRNPQTGDVEYAYKIFSRRPPSDEFLRELLDVPSLHKGDVVSWMHRKLWHAYPFLRPRTSFDGPEMHFPDSADADTSEDAVSGFWYTGGIEPFISTMETSALMGRNVAGLLTRWMEEMHPDADAGSLRPGLRVQDGRAKREPDRTEL